MKTNNNLEVYTLSEADVFVKSWESEAVSYIQRMLYWNREDAQTLYHDACILVLDQLKKGRIDSIAKGYLFKTCKNLGANTWRNVQRKKKYYEQYCIEERTRFQNSVNEKYGITLFEEPDEYYLFESKKALRAFSLLNEKCQKIIALKYVDGKAHKDIADDLGHIGSESSAKTTLSRCIKYWKKIFKDLPK
ncbi:MAG: sigma-70 family RNA polymerase sigma factor [Reichenbachiella sp.]|uniref:RNA polymerase sigma factor n=1 Tax=Reichenbachiella sp. TaxID=2184521 RepID=UPI003265BD11